MSSNPVVAALASPERLEALYHQNQQRFAAHLQEALSLHPQAQILKFWKARLEFNPDHKPALAAGLLPQSRRVILLGCLAFLAARLPLEFGLAEEWYLPRYLPWIVLTALTAYCAWNRQLRSTVSLVIGALSLGSLSWISFLPDFEGSDSVSMALLHAPVVLICGLALAVTAGQWRSTTAIIEFLHYVGELFILVVLIALGGIVMTGLTMALFSLIAVELEDWYAGNVILAGVVSAPLVATLVYEVVLQRRSRFANLIANLFAPLFLLMVLAFLSTMALTGKSPYTDRDFLITFNALLVLVLGITIFVVAGRGRQPVTWLSDAIATGLVGVTLVVNTVALSAILWRLSTWGLTPNRVVVTGANLLICCHLVMILRGYVRLWRGRGSARELQSAVTRYLPVYGIWALLVMVVLPVVFGFR
ncbi:MAG: hypothetical protein RLZZ385_95 [Pseudomonadota bacterium]